MAKKVIILNRSIPDAVSLLKGAEKELAPKIGPIVVGDDNSYFVCTVSYGRGYVMLKGLPFAGNASQTELTIEYSTRSARAEILAALGCISAGLLVDYFFVHPHGWEWLELPIFVLVIFGVPFLISTQSQSVLTRFVDQTLVEP